MIGTTTTTHLMLTMAPLVSVPLGHTKLVKQVQHFQTLRPIERIYSNNNNKDDNNNNNTIFDSLVSSLQITWQILKTDQSVFKSIPLALVGILSSRYLLSISSQSNLEYRKSGFWFRRLVSDSIASLLLHPSNLIFTRIRSDPNGLYKGALDCTAKVILTEGFGGLMKGVWSYMLLRQMYVTLRPVTSGLYDKLTAPIRGLHKTTDRLLSSLKPFVVSLVINTIIYPVDTLTANMMLDGELGTQPKFDGYLDCFQKLKKTNSLYFGFYDHIARVYLQMSMPKVFSIYAR